MLLPALKLIDAKSLENKGLVCQAQHCFPGTGRPHEERSPRLEVAAHISSISQPCHLSPARMYAWVLLCVSVDVARVSATSHGEQWLKDTCTRNKEINRTLNEQLGEQL